MQFCAVLYRLKILSDAFGLWLASHDFGLFRCEHLVIDLDTFQQFEGATKSRGRGYAEIVIDLVVKPHGPLY